MLTKTTAITASSDNLLDQLVQQQISTQQIFELMNEHHLTDKLIRELIVGRAIDTYSCTQQEEEAYLDRIFAKRLETGTLTRELDRSSSTVKKLLKQCQRKIRLQKFKEDKFGSLVKSHFLKRKSQLDYVVYSLIQHPDCGLIQELFFRLQSKEQSFSELAETYSQGTEALTKGIKGPVPFQQLPGFLADLFRTSQPGEVRMSHHNDNYLLLQVEAIIPAVLDERMTQELLQELFEQWLDKEISKLVA